MKNIYTDMELALPMYNAHPYFSLKNLAKKSVCYTWQYTLVRTSKWKQQIVS